MLSQLLDLAPVIKTMRLPGSRGNAGMRPERRCKSGMDGVLTAATLFSPRHHLRTDVFLSNRWGPPQCAPLLTHLKKYQSCKYQRGGIAIGSADAMLIMALRRFLADQYRDVRDDKLFPK